MTDGGGGVEGGGEEGVEQEVRLARGDSAPWGFRMMGGRDFSHPLTVTKVMGRSVAEHAGLKVGDVIVKVNGERIAGATHREAQEAVRAAGDSITITVIRSPIEMPPPLEVDLPVIQPPLAHEAPPPAEQEPPPAEQEPPQAEQEPPPAEQEVQGEGEDADHDVEEDEEEEEEEEEDESLDEDEEARRERLDKLDGIRPRMVRSPGPEDILRMQEKALARMERARARKDRPPTVFLIPPDRPPLRQAAQRRPRPPEPPFKKLVQERIRRRKWLQEHPGEEYPFSDELGRTPTPDSEASRADLTPTPTFSDGGTATAADVEDLTHDGLENTSAAGDLSAGEGDGDVDTRAALDEDPSLRSEAEGDQSFRSEEGPGQDLESLSLEGVAAQLEALHSRAQLQQQESLEDVAAQLEALRGLPSSLHSRAQLQQLIGQLQQQLEELESRAQEERRRREEEERRRREEEERQEREEEERRRREEEERRRKEEEERRAAERDSAARSNKLFKTDVPDFIHEMTEKLSLERPSFPLTPLPRPIVLPGGRKWRTVADAFNEDFITETLTSQAEVLLGRTLGGRRKSKTFPALVHERAEINESCYGCGRINFHKYSHKHDHLKNSAVYRMVHGLDEQPAPPIAARSGRMQAIEDYYEAAARQSATPSPVTRLGRAEAEPDSQ